jgi:hypothetical protein
MRLRVVLLNVLKFSRLTERRDVPVQVPQPFVKVRVTTPDVTNVALEVLHIDGVEADDSCEETNICFSYLLAVVVGIGVLRKVLFGAIEGGE